MTRRPKRAGKTTKRGAPTKGTPGKSPKAEAKGFASSPASLGAAAKAEAGDLARPPGLPGAKAQTEAVAQSWLPKSNSNHQRSIPPFSAAVQATMGPVEPPANTEVHQFELMPVVTLGATVGQPSLEETRSKPVLTAGAGAFSVTGGGGTRIWS